MLQKKNCNNYWLFIFTHIHTYLQWPPPAVLKMAKIFHDICVEKTGVTEGEWTHVHAEEFVQNGFV